ncbi:hypothetical protein A8713_12165 [Streptomyces sp. SAT1]|uniref:DUF4129 domain-containing protein n=1 Tax=Streptomyces sp. SAT1 TaxID=1849967 RepID=UPI0007DDA6F3|nr:DUF4129 domain-containing protein [Streptomyces sp. SAT1]ANH91825.1 hypothetical protein A8713_12165 [Streptomyces sp. SAT1]
MSLPGGVLTAPSAPARAADHADGILRSLPRTGRTLALAQPGPGGTPPVTLPRDPAREAARRELSKRVYHENDPGLFQRALDHFWDWVGRLFDSASTATPGGTAGLVVIVLAVLAVLGALWWRLGTPHRAPASAPALFDDRPRSAAEHRAAAEAHAAQGHWNPAVQERMRALVRSLEERALLDTRPGRTADEAAAEAGRALPAHADRLHTAARDFDDVTYGGRRATEQTYRHIAVLDRDLEHTRPQPAASTTSTADTTQRGAAG